jgi:hypothetical protein
MFRYLLLSLIAAAAPGAEPPEVRIYRGTCDASAAVALDEQHFLVADDEHNTLYVYRRGEFDRPATLLPWDRALGIDPDGKHPEADIEGAAWLGGRVYWITSHGRNRNGKWRPNRHRFFAMTARVEGGRATAEAFGRAYSDLARDLESDPRLRALRIHETIRSGENDLPRLAPKDEGLNIEGLAAGADGRSLLLGFRNPRPGGKALVVPLINPEEVVLGRAAPKLGKPVLLDLRVRLRDEIIPLGIRSMEYVPAWEQYLVVAGPHDERRVFALFRWSGEAGSRPEMLREATAAVARVKDFSPEAAFVRPDAAGIQLLSDDGSLRVKVASPEECLPGGFRDGFCEQKALLDPARKTFKSLWIGGW